MTGHIVQFYEKEGFLSGVVADFQPSLVIATPAHCRAFEEELTARGLGGRATFLDAEETLALFMSGGQPDPHRLRTAVGGLLMPEMRAYGEMVDLLWRDGRSEEH